MGKVRSRRGRTWLTSIPGSILPELDPHEETITKVRPAPWSHLTDEEVGPQGRCMRAGNYSGRYS